MLLSRYFPFVLVKQQSAPVVEAFGKYSRVLSPGFNWKLPIIEEIAFYHSLKEQVLDIDSQTAITKDNVKIKIDGVLYFKVTDAIKASYAVSEPIKALSLLAQTSMRSEIGLLELDRTFEERELLNMKVKSALQLASTKWGIDCMRYEIKDIKPPEQIKRSMELQAESERIKRSKILNSEGERDSAINAALAFKQSLILEGEGQAQQILQEARGIVESLDQIASAIEGSNGTMNEAALRLRLSQQYVAALSKVYSEAKIVGLPHGMGSSTDQIVTALELYKQIVQQAPQQVDEQAKYIAGIREQLNTLDQKLGSVKSGEGLTKQFKFFDDKALY